MRLRDPNDPFRRYAKRARPCARGRFNAPLGGRYGAPESAPGSAGVTFNGRIAIIGDSNAVGACNFGASGQQDSGYGVEAIGGTGFAACQIDKQWSQSITNPVTWLTMNGNLRAYDIAGNLNAGHEQTLGRAVVQFGLHASPKISNFALSGSTQHTHWRTDSTFPNNPATLHSQCVSYLQARETALGGAHDVIIVVLGENDTSSSTNANATEVDLGNIIGGLRTALGRPTQLVYLIVINSATTGANASTVISQQLSYIASDSNCRAIRVDDIPMASNPHYGANGYYTIGDRIARQINKDFFADTPRSRVTVPGAGAYLADRGSCVTIAAAGTGSPRAGAEERDRDYQLLVITGQSADATYTLSTPAGFTAVNAKFESVFSGTNHRTMAVYERLVTTAAQTVNGYMASPVITATGVQSSIAEILTFRSAAGWTASPMENFQTGANNANSTALVIAGGTTSAANCLGVVINSVPATSNTGPLTTSCSNGSITYTKIFEMIGNQASFVGEAVWTGPIATSGTVVGNSTLVMAAAGVNTGCYFDIKPS